MTTIRSTCPLCGEVDLRPEQILLHVPRDGRSVYQFMCPACLDPVEKPADGKVAALLVSAGVDFATEDSLLGEPLDPLDDPLVQDRMDEPPDGLPFTLDDLMTFHFLLQGDTSVREFLEAQPSDGP
jgi:hypothetical protein